MGYGAVAARNGDAVVSGVLADEQLAGAEHRLRREITTAERKVADLKEEIRRKQRELSAVRVLRGTDAVAKPSQRVTSQKIQDAAYEILNTKATAMHFRDLYRALEESGLALGGKDPASGLITYLTRDRERFEWVSRGTYRAKAPPSLGTLEDRAERR
jgi:hypothetical protein